jgi:hypothetical protein
MQCEEYLRLFDLILILLIFGLPDQSIFLPVVAVGRQPSVFAGLC